MSSALAQTIHKHSSKPWQKWLTVLLLLIVLAAGFYWYQKRRAGQDEGPQFETQALRRGDISLDITATGNLAPTNEVTVGSELSGTCVEVYVDTNDEVKKDQPLAKLDTIKFAQDVESSRASLLSAQANVSQAEATLAESEATLARFQELHRLSHGQSPSEADMQTAIASLSRAKADLEAAKASIAIAEANLRSNERDLGKTVITSPVNGIILTRTLEVGQTVAASLNAPELFTIAEDLRKMDLVVTVAEADIGRVEKGQTATFTVDAWPNRFFSAVIKKVAFGSTVTDNVVTYNTELEVANDDLSLRPGMTATADISVAKETDVFLIPNVSLRFDPQQAMDSLEVKQEKQTLVQSLAPGPGRRRFGRSSAPRTDSSAAKTGPHIWVLRDGEPVQIAVETGISNGRFTAATSPELTEGMQVITSIKPSGQP